MPRALVSATGGLAVSESPIASQVGSLIMSRGGNAVDAAVAMSLSLAVLLPHLGGIGGDFFALIVDPGGRKVFLNGSGQSPSRLTLEELRSHGSRGIPARGPLPIVVPGMLGGLYEMWKSLGSMEWRDLVEPAKRLAIEGFPAPASLARSVEAYSDYLSLDPGSRETYLNPRPVEGELYRFPGLGSLLETIAESPEAFYSGEIAGVFEEYLSSQGGLLSSRDLREYEASWGDPLVTEYRGWGVYETPPNTQGVTSLHILKLLEGWSTPSSPYSEERARQLLAASIPSYDFRDRNLGDEGYMRIPVGDLLSPEVLEELGFRATELIDSGFVWEVEEGADTTYFAVVDRDGMVVSGIQSLFYPFGSAVTEPKTQVTFNNRALCFTLQEGLPNTLAPSKRPLHTLSAMILEGEGRVIAIGASGGHLRPQQHALFATNIIDYKMSLDEALSAPRIAWEPGTRRLLYEEGFEKPRIEGFKPEKRERIGVGSAVELRGGIKRGATDKRGEGIPSIAL